jgi:doubled CXXCH motif protein
MARATTRSVTSPGRLALGSALGALLWLAAAPCWAQQARAPVADEKTLFEQPGRIPSLLADKRITPEQVPNPHWRPDACGACHQGTPRPGDLGLRNQDRNALCNTCHERAPVPRFEHPVGVAPSSDMLARMRQSKLGKLSANGTLECTTCHDLPMQCLPERAGGRGLNPRFLRGAPYQARAEFCFQCHDSEGFQRLNPHDQRARDGSVKEGTCFVCHRRVPDRATVRGAAQADLLPFKEPNALCTGCHQIRLHPGGISARGGKLPNHTVKPSPKMATRLEQVGLREGVYMPLDERGRIFCATCHDPHQQGVLPNAPSRAATEQHRLRMKNICLGCHDM